MALWWDIIYWLRRTPWDTGVTPPEIVSMIDSGQVTSGCALDLGCGTGTNAIYLGRHGFTVIGIDISRRAISLARRKARSAQLTDRVRFERGDVSVMRRWVTGHSIDFAYDIGCFHNLDAGARIRYAAALIAVLKPGAIYMLYAFEPSADRRGVDMDEIAQLFDRAFQLAGLRRGRDRNGRGSAWYTFVKREA